MRIFRLVAAATFLAAITALPAYAQQTAGRPAAPATAAATNAAVPDTKIALINTEAFGDEKAGIGRLVNAVKGVDREFTPRKNELQTLQQSIQKLTTDIQTQQNSGVVDPKALQAKIDQLEQMKKDFTRKGEDAQAAYNKRMSEVAGPIYDDIGKSLDAFTKQRGITLLLDGSKLAPAILTFSDAMDITRAFITEYNSRNPATASARE
jgi:Skp family chaperone for outer membrane proteins